jgi:hypothetical protein
MKSYLYGFFMIAISCTSSNRVQERPRTDSLVVEDSGRTVQTPIEVVADENKDETEPLEQIEAAVDSAWLREFAGRPLGMNPYEYLRGLLEGKNVNFTDSVLNEETDIVFGNSIITILLTEAYGNVVCSADIETPEIPMMMGVTIGMPREDFLTMTGISASLLTKNSNNKEYVEFNLYYEESTSTRTTFWLDEKSLIRVQYVFSPCIMYD